MKIRHKGIHLDRFEDAPFVGALISSIDCSRNCPGCINQHLKSAPYITEELSDIFDRILDNPFNEGIILGGLSWDEQPGEMLTLVDTALLNNLKVIIYTHCSTKDELLSKVPGLDQYQGRGVLVKYGEYDESKRVYNYIDHGVVLATSNQYIDEL